MGAGIHVMAEMGGIYALADDGAPIAEANEFLAALRVRGLSSRTIRAYAYDLLLLYRWMRTLDASLGRLESSDLIAFIAMQREAGAEPRSINRRLSTARLLYRFWMGSEIGASTRVTLPAPHFKGPGRDHYLGIHKLGRHGVRKLRVSEARKLVEPLTP